MASSTSTPSPQSISAPEAPSNHYPVNAVSVPDLYLHLLKKILKFILNLNIPWVDLGLSFLVFVITTTIFFTRPTPNSSIYTEIGEQITFLNGIHFAGFHGYPPYGQRNTNMHGLNFRTLSPQINSYNNNFHYELDSHFRHFFQFASGYINGASNFNPGAKTYPLMRHGGVGGPISLSRHNSN